MGNFIDNIRTRVWWKNALSLLLLCLLIANVCIIFGLSSEDAAQSTDRSEGVADVIAGVIVDGYHEMDTQHQQNEIHKIHVPLRTVAHFSLFACLGFISTVLVYSLGLKKWYFTMLSPLLFGLVYAVFDELHQQFSANRVSDVDDVLTDFAGVLVAVLITNVVAIALLKARQAKGGES